MRATSITDEERAAIEESIENILGNKATDEDRLIARVMLCSLLVGPNIVRVAKALGIGRHQVRPISTRLRAEKIWQRGRVHANWCEEGGGLSLLCDIMVVQGYLTRTGDTSPEDGHPLYTGR